MAAGTPPDAWKELCRIGLIREGGSLVEFNALTEDITAMDWGERDIEGAVLCGGGRVPKTVAMTDESITLKMWPVSALLTGTGVSQLFHAQSADDSTDPIEVLNTTAKRKKYGIILLWASTLPATAATTVAVGQTGYRIQIINAFMTSYKPSYDDKNFSAEVTFKWCPFQKGAGANKREDSSYGNTGEQLAAGITTATSF